MESTIDNIKNDEWWYRVWYGAVILSDKCGLEVVINKSSRDKSVCLKERVLHTVVKLIVCTEEEGRVRQRGGLV